jgi:hypothetical protein
VRIGTIGHLEGESVTRFDELNPHQLLRGSGAVLDLEGERIALAVQIEIAVSPGMELRGAAQRLARPSASCTLLGMMDDEDSQSMPPLQFAKIGKEGGDLTAGVLVDAVEAYERIEDNRRGCSFPIVSARLRRSASRSRRREGAVMDSA